MITIEQIKAGRALLDWNQDDLAKHSGVSKAAINKTERRIVGSRADTLRKLQDAMETAGVEFTSGPGVRLRGDVLQVRIFEGGDAIFRLFEDITESLQSGEEILCNGIDEKKFIKAGEKRFIQQLGKWVKAGIKSRVLSQHGDNFFVDEREHYRWVPPEKFSSVPYYVYANKYSIILWEPVQRIMLIENKPIADSYRKQFNTLWKEAAKPPAYLKTSYILKNDK